MVHRKVVRGGSDDGRSGVGMTTELAPFNEMSTLVLTCDVFGATPSARVSWWVDGRMIDDGYEEIAPGKSRNTMRLETLTRNYSDAEFTCVGTNTNDNNHAITISTDIKLNREYLQSLFKFCLFKGRQGDDF